MFSDPCSASKGTCVPSIWLFDFAGGSWTTLINNNLYPDIYSRDYDLQRTNPAAAMIGSDVYFFGGYSTQSGVTWFEYLQA